MCDQQVSRVLFAAIDAQEPLLMPQGLVVTRGSLLHAESATDDFVVERDADVEVMFWVENAESWHDKTCAWLPGELQIGMVTASPSFASRIPGTTSDFCVHWIANLGPIIEATVLPLETEA